MLVPRNKYKVIGFTALRCDNCGDEDLKRILHMAMANIEFKKFTCDACDHTQKISSVGKLQ